MWCTVSTPSLSLFPFEKALYRFISDDDPKHGPSLASVAPQALAQGWLDLTVATTNFCRKPFQSGAATSTSF